MARGYFRCDRCNAVFKPKDDSSFVLKLITDDDTFEPSDGISMELCDRCLQSLKNWVNFYTSYPIRKKEETQND